MYASRTMASFFRIIFCCILHSVTVMHMTIAYDHSFNQNYYPFWGFNHFTLIQQGDDEVQLLIDPSSGAGFRSKLEYESGRFHIRMKIPKQKTEGLVPNFYLISRNSGQHSELDLEFIGTKGVLQTNVFANDRGGREQRFNLWFDPSEDFHSYDILWNQHQIVFLVDDIPIRAFKNNTAIGAKFPSEPLHIEATVWNATWAGNVNWTLSPFITFYRDFSIAGCQADYSRTGKCSSPVYDWNKEAYWDLNEQQKQQLHNIRNSYMFYDYCKQSRSNSTYPECSISD